MAVFHVPRGILICSSKGIPPGMVAVNEVYSWLWVCSSLMPFCRLCLVCVGARLGKKSREMAGATNATLCGLLRVGSGIWGHFWFAVLERWFLVSEAFTLNFTLEQFLPSSPRSPCTIHYQDGYSDYMWDQENDCQVGHVPSVPLWTSFHLLPCFLHMPPL